MKIVISIIIVMFAVVNSYAAICGDEIVLKITSAATCDESPADYPYNLASNCTATQKDNNCILTSFTVCCDDTALSYKDAVSITQTITDVPLGQERDAVIQAFNYWKSVTPFKDPLPGFIQTDSLEGFAYISNAGTAAVSADVTWVGWKRSGYVKQGAGGEYVPLEDIINSGSGSSSIDYVQMKDAFVQALQTDNLSGVQAAVEAAMSNKIGADTIKQALKEAIAESGGLSGGGSSISLSDLQGLLDGEYFGYDDAFDYGYDSGFGQIGDIPDLFDSFVNDIKQTGLFSLPDKFFGSVPTSDISSITIDAGRYGVHEYDFASGAWPTVLGIIKGIIMVIFSFASVRTIIMKR
jgi:hypothetical protein